MTGASNIERLTVKSSLLLFLRALYSLMLPCGVYVRDGHEPIFVTKEQLVTLVGLGKAESPVSSLPALAKAGLLRNPIGPLSGWDGVQPEQDNALVLNANGARVCSIRDVLTPPAPVPPEWWDAPLPFAMCANSGLKINAAAARAFGTELERLRVTDLPPKDEFIVELEGRNHPCFLTFRRLPSRPGEAVVFILDDCTGDLAEAQDISWWAAVGRSWVASIESNGGAWHRAENPPEGSDAKVLSCEWQGRFMGYLCVDGAETSTSTAKKATRKRRVSSSSENVSATGTRKKSTGTTSTGTSAKVKTTRKRKKKAINESGESSEPAALKEDTLIQELSPQTMALLSAGQDRSTDFDLDALDELGAHYAHAGGGDLDQLF